ncbi:HAMP domain-containing protein [Burkholderia glumae]|uniref:methyl-accepting chemotaxis protein n=1 Tax=Burkholderia glumae TaxID=337 RepID=UPI000F5DB852|nr:methyl-accepting chemotaxis protein [Burkholderia glumae]MCR1768977.1 MCP four helix bundle domain-containing protein [Burkholderia glumae]QHP89595.1 HAMP domain-containing protein [Burkholderia glumae]QJW77370.1 HAMP domain-containing protein [Burkholderia glumae]QKM46839.1 Methyl-accepting chemotaxis protein I [Burkholderia glumae]RQZ75197.1 HAMP domain-containing protein [Burkholderia glumae]
MKALNNLKIGVRLGGAFAVTLALLCMVGALALIQASRIHDNTTDLAANWLPSVQTLGDVRAYANTVRRSSISRLVALDEQERSSYWARHETAAAKLDATMKKYEQFIASPEEGELFRQIKTAWAAYSATDARLHQLMQDTDHFDDARRLAAGDSSRLFATFADLVEQDIALNAAGAARASAEADASYRGAIWLTSVLIIIALGMSMVVAYFITRSITTPIRTSVSIAETVARGDLTSRIEVAGRDETSQLLRALKSMNERLAEVVGRVRAGSDSIATGASQIAAGNSDLSQRTEEQAASLEETAASMEQLTATVKQNTESAQQGNSLAANASEVARRGGDVVGRVVTTMREISASSAKVGEIISVIEGIAFQTNILALNAAVEAARAGDQGRGFAVVAGEVRTLAQRSATAAKEIKTLIESSVERVQAGSGLVDEAGRTMEEVVQSVQRVADLMGEISAASVEQRTGIEQVNIAVTQMDEVTQQNAALVEEASAAAQSMAAQSNALRETVSIFRLDLHSQPSVAPARPSSGLPVAPAKVPVKAPVKARSMPVRDGAPAPKPSDGSSEWASF